MAQQDDVVSGLALGLGRALGRELETLDGVQLDRDAGLFAEGLGLAAQLIVGRGNEVTPAEEGELAALGECRSAFEGEGGPCPGRSTNELPARELSHGRTSSIGAAGSPPFGQVAGRDRRAWAPATAGAGRRGAPRGQRRRRGEASHGPYCIDVHRKGSQIYILGEGGEIIEGRIGAEAERCAGVLGTRPAPGSRASSVRS